MHYHQNLQFFVLRTLATTVNRKKIALTQEIKYFNRDGELVLESKNQDDSKGLLKG